MEDNQNETAFQPISKNNQGSNDEVAATAEKYMDYQKTDVFAKGLPEWDLIPSQILVRRNT